jgi:hypothetical protein
MRGLAEIINASGTLHSIQEPPYRSEFLTDALNASPSSGTSRPHQGLATETQAAPDDPPAHTHRA